MSQHYFVDQKTKPPLGPIYEQPMMNLIFAELFKQLPPDQKKTVGMLVLAQLNITGMALQ